MRTEHNDNKLDKRRIISDNPVNAELDLDNDILSPLSDEKKRGSRWHWFRLYYDIDVFTDILKKHSSQINHAHYILHDKDVDDKGEKIKPHIHCLLYLVDYKTSSAVSKWFSDTCGFYPSNVDDPEIAARYEIHAGFDDKYQYAVEEVRHIGSSRFFENALSRYDVKYDTSISALNDLLSGIGYLECARKYGKDFIYHVSCYKSLLELIRIDNLVRQIEENENQILKGVKDD